jgi:hypothetical protein
MGAAVVAADVVGAGAVEVVCAAGVEVDAVEQETSVEMPITRQARAHNTFVFFKVTYLLTISFRA